MVFDNGHAYSWRGYLQGWQGDHPINGAGQIDDYILDVHPFRRQSTRVSHVEEVVADAILPGQLL